MPYQQQSGQYNKMRWFLTNEELAFMQQQYTLKNRDLLHHFNQQFACHISYARMRHFLAQYGLKKQEKGEAYTDVEKDFVCAQYEKMSDKHMGEALGRTEKSIMKLRRCVLKLHRSEEATKQLRHFRSKSGAKAYHARIARGELQHPAVALHDSFVQGQIKKGTNLKIVPRELIDLKKVEFLIKRELKNGVTQRNTKGQAAFT